MLSKLVQFILFALFLLFMFGGSLFFRSGSSIISRASSADFRKSIRADSLYSIEAISGFLSVIVDEAESIKEQMEVNTAKCQLLRIGGLKRISSSQILAPLAIKEGMELSADQIRSLLSHLSSYAWIDHFKVEHKMLPQRISINVKESEPWLVVEYQGRSWLVSTKGELLEPLTSLDNPDLIREAGLLPRLYGIDPPENEQTYLSSVNERLRYASRMLDFVDLSGGLPFSWNSIHLLPLGAIMVEPDSGKPAERVYFRVHSLDEASSMLLQLENVLRDIDERGEKASEIDLRFSGQVVVR
ncbi:MAG TPA: hypothetical protein PKA63_11770 [Oligoflexia bacterium]|nr:hypothetical protein [Oligoflexia bacterium]HMP49331.1 hypothetical protein [Oligoflexia bacterium]